MTFANVLGEDVISFRLPAFTSSYTVTSICSCVL
jgi:hypothetical protein